MNDLANGITLSPKELGNIRAGGILYDFGHGCGKTLKYMLTHKMHSTRHYR
ncbi:hypothetical protein NFX39_05705 [Fructobacillus sp. W13]|uniref:Uncharacterized protein n=1 Tax=Fructobacillus apis TaxID=2935017 RepID=A0ABT0ZRF4_9LACO|nr:hypothetical protein [Fructobacillus apis]MCO0832573.1 hypothetical protein [Fructobacillus apis]